jgi:hypothetical protein
MGIDMWKPSTFVLAGLFTYSRVLRLLVFFLFILPLSIVFYREGYFEAVFGAVWVVIKSVLMIFYYLWMIALGHGHDVS